jgi:hypothetical protein
VTQGVILGPGWHFGICVFISYSQKTYLSHMPPAKNPEGVLLVLMYQLPFEYFRFMKNKTAQWAQDMVHLVL